MQCECSFGVFTLRNRKGDAQISLELDLEHKRTCSPQLCFATPTTNTIGGSQQWSANLSAHAIELHSQRQRAVSPRSHCARSLFRERRAVRKHKT
jgi:hypothetical protein